MPGLSVIVKIKKMKKNQILVLIFTLASTITFSQSKYNIYSKRNSEKVYFEDFLTDTHGWAVGTYEACRIYKWVPGYYELKSVCNGTYSESSTNNNALFSIDQDRDFEIETSMMFVSGENNNSNCISWGQSNSRISDRFRFGFSGNGQYIIDKNYNSSWTNLKSWTESSLINKNAYNKFTIRKIRSQYYFFINESLVHNCPFEPFYGQRLSFQTNQNSTIRVDYIRISYLKKNKSIGPADF